MEPAPTISETRRVVNAGPATVTMVRHPCGRTMMTLRSRAPNVEGNLAPHRMPAVEAGGLGAVLPRGTGPFGLRADPCRRWGLHVASGVWCGPRVFPSPGTPFFARAPAEGCLQHSPTAAVVGRPIDADSNRLQSRRLWVLRAPGVGGPLVNRGCMRTGTEGVGAWHTPDPVLAWAVRVGILGS